MSSNVLRIGTASLFLLGLAVTVAAEPPVVKPAPPVVVGQPAQPAQPAPAAAATATFRAKQVLGSKVMIQNNTAVGTVDDIVFDDAGNLEYLIVAHEGKLFTVPWDAAKWDLKNQTALVNITPQQFKTIPTYTATTYPNFWEPAYRTDVYKVYGVTPRQLRRIERRIP